ncbi:MAG TPA: hypothetical protein ENF88_00990 [Candidatus Acetothermia bacterium]|nr:MAG: hypothetical protein DRO73_10650 [Candidatus Thorarchaeota archaeon]HDO74308.1 hypothetical protein [Candidatus Acetothermia bacterium]HEX32250.1 hypothetical protein [Candidatus Acetothermia bacterium]
MKLTGLRALVVVMSSIALLSVIGLGANLESIASNELVPEISAAAGMALADSYAATMTEAELEALAVDGRTIGLRTAASGALAILYRDKTEDEIMAILKGDADPMIRAAAIEPAQVYLVSVTSDDEDFKLTDYLKDIAINGETHEMRLAAAKAYYFMSRKSLKAADLEEQAVTNDSDELAYAAGETLSGFYLSFNPKTQAELEDLAINGSSEGLRVAGEIALSSLLIKSDLTALDFETTLLSIAGTKSAEYRGAYKIALANRYAQ